MVLSLKLDEMRETKPQVLTKIVKSFDLSENERTLGDNKCSTASEMNQKGFRRIHRANEKGLHYLLRSLIADIAYSHPFPHFENIPFQWLNAVLEELWKTVSGQILGDCNAIRKHWRAVLCCMV